MVTQRLESGFRLHTHPAPPQAFELARATDDERALYGFPARSLAFPELESRWHEKLRGFRLVEPTFAPRVRKRRRATDLGPVHGPLISQLWSGALVNPPAGDKIKWVEGTWETPSVSAPPKVSNGIWYYASAWIGIDGWTSGDVLQAGCDSKVRFAETAAQAEFLPWWEWYPGASFWITSMPVSPGDTLTCLICVQEKSTTAASIFLGNTTTHVGTSFSATAPPDVSLNGDSAEWIVEALGEPPELARYTPVNFLGCRAGTNGGKTVLGGSGTTINMLDSNAYLISQGEIVSPTHVRATFV